MSDEDSKYDRDDDDNDDDVDDNMQNYSHSVGNVK